MAKDRSQRYQKANDVANDLEKAIEVLNQGVQVVTAPPSIQEKTKKRHKSRISAIKSPSKKRPVSNIVQSKKRPVSNIVPPKKRPISNLTPPKKNIAKKPEPENEQTLPLDRSKIPAETKVSENPVLEIKPKNKIAKRKIHRRRHR